MTKRDTTHALPAGWRETTLGEVAVVVTGKTPSKENPEDWGAILDFITPTDFTSDSKYLSNPTRRLSETGKNRFKRMLIPAQSVLVTCIGSDMGKVAVNVQDCLTNQQINSLVVREGFDIDFVYYKLKNSYSILKSRAEGGSTMPILNKSNFEALQFTFPPFPEQRAIADMLSCLDDKIELLRRQNGTLETIARTVWQERFGRYSPERPEELPAGWRVGRLGEIVDLLNGFAYRSADFTEDGKYRLVTIANVQDGFFVTTTKDGLAEIPEKMPNHCHLETGDILLSLTGNVGRVCHVIGKNYLLNQRVARLQARNPSDSGFIYIYFRQPKMVPLLENLSSGTAQQNLSPIKTVNLETIIPTREALDEFATVANSITPRMLSNLEQIQTLLALRDTLLPRVMSGEISPINV